MSVVGPRPFIPSESHVEGWAVPPLRGAPGHHRPLAGLRPQRPDPQRPRPARLPLRGLVVAVVGPQDHVRDPQDHGPGHRRLLSPPDRRLLLSGASLRGRKASRPVHFPVAKDQGFLCVWGLQRGLVRKSPPQNAFHRCTRSRQAAEWRLRFGQGGIGTMHQNRILASLIGITTTAAMTLALVLEAVPASATPGSARAPSTPSSPATSRLPERARVPSPSLEPTSWRRSSHPRPLGAGVLRRHLDPPAHHSRLSEPARPG